MDVINRIRGTITNVITGNPLVGEFEMLEQKASGGPGMLWKVYDGIKRSTKQEVSIFVYEKKLLERYHRRDRDIIIDVLKKGVTQLTKLRHPKILSVLHPVEESRECLAFATEPVFTSLANVLCNYDNLPSPMPADIRDFKLYDVEIKYGLLHVVEGLSFLHNDVKMVHNGICPRSIFINKNGAWKLAGFDYAIPNANAQESSPYYPFKEWEAHMPPVTQPSLNYLAPEYALSKCCDTATDMFSLGILLYAIFNGGKTLYDCRDEWSAFKKNAAELKSLKISLLGSVPEDVRDHVKMLLNTEPTVRPDADQITKIPFFEDVGARTLQYLDSLVQQDNLQRSQFFKNLPKILAKLPKRVCIQRILPSLFSECSNVNMIPFLLPNILQVAAHCSEQEFAQKILPGLIPIFALQQPIQTQPETMYQITLVFLQNMSLLLSKTPQNDIRNHVLPMVYRAIEAGNPQIQELCLNIIPTFASLIEYSQMKSAFVPRIKKLCLGTNALRLRVNCLVCLGKLLEYMDKWYVLDEVLPILPQIPSREPAVLMSMLGIYKVALTHKKLGMTKEAMATKILPFLLPLSIDNNLNLPQFNAYFGLINEMMNKVETEQRAKLEQLNTMQQEQRTLQQFAKESFAEDQNAGDGAGGKDDSMMQKVLSGFGLSSMFGITSEKPKSEPRNPLNDVSEIPAPKPKDTQLPNQPAKVNLTLEEKQRMAKEQEQQQRLKAQPELRPATAKVSAPKAQVKDLTSSLLSTDFMGTQKPPSSSGTGFGTSGPPGGLGSGSGAGFGGSTMYGGPPSGGQVRPSVFGANPTSSFSGMSTSSSGFGSGMSSTGGAFNQPMSGMSASSSGFGQSQPSKKVDMSAFDNLLPSSNQRVPMNQMSGKPANPKPASSMGMGAPMGIGSTGTGIMGSNMGGGMGNMGGGMGNMGGGMNSMGNMGGMRNPAPMGVMGGQNFGQPQNSLQQNGGVNPLSNQDLADFLG